MTLPVVKAHAYGNDFLLVPLAGRLSASAEGSGVRAVASREGAKAAPTPGRSELARAMCHRHTGIGADGLLLYGLTESGATMTLLNADGSPSELSGNGLRCLAALVARRQNLHPPASVSVATDAGIKTLELLAIEGERFIFRAALGEPTGIRQVQIPVLGEVVTASVLAVGNPQCVVLGPLPDLDRFNRLGPALSTHAMFPAGTNVEFAEIEAPGRVRILIWERGVGPTTSSGTGTSASAVAAAAHGQALRDVEVIAPGGSQRVEWRQDGVYLTGWAELVMEGTWL